MKIAYFSPMPPARSGIAAYSAHLVPALCETSDVTVFSPGESNWHFEGCEVIDFCRLPWELKTLPRYDAALYHLGNNPHFHLDIYRILAEFPGAAVLHDLVLYYLFAGLGRGGVIKEYCQSIGCDSLGELWPEMDSCPEGDLLRYGSPEKLSFLNCVLSRATSIIVHNQSSADWIRKNSAARVEVVPFPLYPKELDRAKAVNSIEVRKTLGFQNSDFVLGIFGFIGPTKRLPSVLDATSRLLQEQPDTNIKILIVGEGESITQEVKERDLQHCVKETGYVDDVHFTSLLASVDALANLRYPSMGESSATLIQAMALGKPVIVTDDASFSDLPDAAALKVSHEETEVDEILSTLKELIGNRERRRSVGLAAKQFVFDNCSPEVVASSYVRVLETFRIDRDREPAVRRPGSSSLWAKSYLKRRIEDLVPE